MIDPKTLEAFFYAIQQGNIKEIKALLASAGETKQELVNAEYHGKTPLQVAIERAPVDSTVDSTVDPTAVIEILIANGADKDKPDQYYGQTPLHWAVMQNRPDIVSFLIQKGANKDKQDKHYNRTPLHWAVMHNNPSIVTLLINQKADLNKQDNEGKTPLDLLESSSIDAALKMEIKNRLPGQEAKMLESAPAVASSSTSAQKEVSGDQLDLTVVAESEFVDFCNAIKKKGSTSEEIASILAKKEDKVKFELLHKASFGRMTVLEIAIKSASPEVVQILIDKGADPNAQDQWGTTPLHLAVEYLRKDLVELLLKNGANPNEQDIDDQTPLHLAVDSGEKDLVALLLKNEKTDPNVKDYEGRTPLYLAVDREKDLVALLLENEKTDPNVKDNEGQTPLHLAVESGEIDLVALLLSKGADPNAQNDKKQKTLDLAIINNRIEIAGILRQHGAELNTVKGSKKSRVVISALNLFGKKKDSKKVDDGASSSKGPSK